LNSLLTFSYRNNGHTDVEVEMAVLGAKEKKEVASRWRTGTTADLEKGVDVQTRGRNDGTVAFEARVTRREMVSFVL